MSSCPIAVVVPLYNKTERIEPCLQSVLQQSLAPAAIVVIDDGSGDDSALKVARLTEQYPQIQLIRQDNAGVSAARNRGWQSAEAPYIAFLDADDSWYPEFVAKAWSLIKDYPEADLYSLGHLKYDEHHGLLTPPLGVAQRGYVADFFAAAAHGVIACSSSVVVRRAALAGMGGFPAGEASGEDLYTWARLAERSGKAVAFDPERLSLIYQAADQSRAGRTAHLPYVLRYYSQRPRNLMQHPSLKSYVWRIAYLHVLGALADGEPRVARARAALVRHLFGAKGWALWVGTWLPGLQAILKRLRHRRRAKWKITKKVYR